MKHNERERRKRLLKKYLAAALSLLLVFTALPLPGLTLAAYEPAVEDITGIDFEGADEVYTEEAQLPLEISDEDLNADPSSVIVSEKVEESEMAEGNQSVGLGNETASSDTIHTVSFWVQYSEEEDAEPYHVDFPVINGDRITERPAPEKSDDHPWPSGANGFLFWSTTPQSVVGATYDEEWQPYSYFDFTTPITSDLDLYAHFRNTILISFVDGPGGNVVETQVLSPGHQIDLPSPENVANVTVPQESYLRHWYVLGQDEEIAFDFANSSATTDLTLVPKFGGLHYVLFISAGSQIIFETGDIFQNVRNGAYASAPSTNPVRAGWTFQHWSTTENGNTAFNFATTPITANTTLYAVWTAQSNIPYRIAVWLERPNFDGTPTPGIMGQYNFVYTYMGNNARGYAGAQITNAMIQTAINSLFASTNNDATTGILKFANLQGMATGTSYYIDGNGTTIVNVFAARKVYTYRFPTGNNDRYMTIRSQTGGGGTASNRFGNGSSYPIYERRFKLGQDITETWPAGDGVSFSGLGNNYFDGWTNPNISQTGVNHLSRRTILDESLLPASGNNANALTFTLQTTTNAQADFRYFRERLTGEPIPAGTYTITRDDITYIEMIQYRQNMNSTTNAKTIAGMASTRPGGAPYRYNLSYGVYTANNTGTYRIFFYHLNSYNLTFELQVPGGTTVGNAPQSPRSLKYLQPLADYRPTWDPTRAGHRFLGWYRDSEYREVFDWNITMPIGGAIAYAKWEPTQYSVRFHYTRENMTQGIVPIATVGKASGQNVNRADLPYIPGASVEGHGELTGWYFLNSAGQQIAFSLDIPITGDRDLFGDYRTTGFTVTYEAGMGTGTPPTSPYPTFEAGTETTIQTGISITPPSGEVFIGWMVVGDNSGRLWQHGQIFRIWGTTRFIAQFAPPASVVQLIHHSNYEGGPADVVWYLKQNIGNLPLTQEYFTREGYIQEGWSITSESTERVTSVNITNQTPVHVYAIWEQTEYFGQITITRTIAGNDRNPFHGNPIFTYRIEGVAEAGGVAPIGGTYYRTLRFTRDSGNELSTTITELPLGSYTITELPTLGFETGTPVRITLEPENLEEEARFTGGANRSGRPSHSDALRITIGENGENAISRIADNGRTSEASVRTLAIGLDEAILPED